MRVTVLALVLGLTACSPANSNDAEFWTPSTGDPVTDEDTGAVDEDAAVVLDDSGTVVDTGTKPKTDSGTTPPPTDSGTTPTGTCLHVEFTTVSVGGKYSPSHVGAVWITDSSGKFVKTLQEWGTKRQGYLTKWKASSGSNTVDAITGATLKSHGTHKLDWNCTNVSKAAVPAGTYNVNAEFTEQNGAGPTFSASFTVGTAKTDNPADSTGYKAKVITSK